MKKADLHVLARRVISDPAFRKEFMADPEVAINEAGWDLPPDDVAALKAWHANVTSMTTLEELERGLADFVASRSPQMP